MDLVEKDGIILSENITSWRSMIWIAGRCGIFQEPFVYIQIEVARRDSIVSHNGACQVGPNRVGASVLPRDAHSGSHSGTR